MPCIVREEKPLLTDESTPVAQRCFFAPKPKERVSNTKARKSHRTAIFAEKRSVGGLTGGSGLIGSPSWQSQTGRVWEMHRAHLRPPMTRGAHVAERGRAASWKRERLAEGAQLHRLMLQADWHGEKLQMKTQKLAGWVLHS